MAKPDECLHCAIVEAVKRFQGPAFNEPDELLKAVAASGEALADFISQISTTETRKQLARDHAKRLPGRVEEKHSRKANWK